MFHISIIISEQLLQISLSLVENHTFRTYPLASSRVCKNELSPVAEVT